jgi:hypothetical protein
VKTVPSRPDGLFRVLTTVLLRPDGLFRVRS